MPVQLRLWFRWLCVVQVYPLLLCKGGDIRACRLSWPVDAQPVTMTDCSVTAALKLSLKSTWAPWESNFCKYRHLDPCPHNSWLCPLVSLAKGTPEVGVPQAWSWLPVGCGLAARCCPSTCRPLLRAGRKSLTPCHHCQKQWFGSGSVTPCVGWAIQLVLLPQSPRVAWLQRYAHVPWGRWHSWGPCAWFISTGGEELIHGPCAARALQVFVAASGLASKRFQPRCFDLVGSHWQ